MGRGHTGAPVARPNNPFPPPAFLFFLPLAVGTHGRPPQLGTAPNHSSPPPLAPLAPLATFRHVRTFYMAVPPFLYPDISGCCVRAGLRRTGPIGGGGHPLDRWILEKPFGKDTESCAELCAAVAGNLDESTVYRIDHYLGKANKATGLRGDPSFPCF